ncbi:MAG: Uma2 family endonuclease [Moorea sp. SIOASIH]|uniref:Uma2 family endonuclease n=1 Tax=Moorena sp. SIOASIH TaxID=2607817 RepID=UPI0013BCED9F|nr:Uma2 family endonuclease [Moorena sp. SIOASIH]NEO38614.1 Uma2 family endonuclease [Moorena sp. SIOASIH]
MTNEQLKPKFFYRNTNGTPMAESDPNRDYIIYGVEALKNYFKNRDDVYVSGNLSIYYLEGIYDAVIEPDVFVIFGVENKLRKHYKVWEEGGNFPSWILEVTSINTKGTDQRFNRQTYQDMGVLEYMQYDPVEDYLQPPLKGLRLVEGNYEPIASKPLGDEDFSIYSEVLGLELQVHQGKLEFFDPKLGKKLLNFQELDMAYQEAEQALQQTEQALQKAISHLLGLGVSVEQIAEALSISVEEVNYRVQH